MSTDWRDWKSPYDDGRDKTVPVTAAEALPGRDDPSPALQPHAVRGVAVTPPFPAGMHTLVVGMGCFWGAERVFWPADGVYTTAVGYAGGFTRNPSYEQVCSARTGHAEVVLVVFDPARLELPGALRLFWENHDPTQDMRQGDDVGTQYRSTILYADDEQRRAAETGRAEYQRVLTAAGLGLVRTEIAPLREFFYAEPFHQQILAREPDGYCGLGGTGVSCPVGTGA